MVMSSLTLVVMPAQNIGLKRDWTGKEIVEVFRLAGEMETN